MTEFPNNISVDKPIPRKSRFEYGVRIKNTDAICNSSYGNEFANRRIQHIRKKGYLITDNLKLPVKQGNQRFNNHYDWK